MCIINSKSIVAGMAALLASCAPQGAEKSGDAGGALTTKAVAAPADLFSVMGTTGEGIAAVATGCPPTMKAPSKAYILRAGRIDPYELKEQFIEKATDGGYDEAPADPNPLPYIRATPKPGPAGTPLDFTVKVEGDNSILIKIDLTNSPLTFMKNSASGTVMAITAGDPVGQLMLCKAERRSDKIATVIMYKNPSVAAGAWGAYNLGLVAKQADGTFVPFHLDPNIKNDG